MRNVVISQLVDGSSPRTWGTDLLRVHCRGGPRFIPTHVGNRAPSPRARAARPVHPHARGEQENIRNRVSSTSGSSPRTWGTAGSPLSKSTRSSVHPHARGEQSFWVIAPDSRIGSSPRTWGTGELSAVRAASSRFIPTHVGNSWGIMGMPCGMAVHPHARGEQSSAPSPASAPRGSSPRTWGTASFRILCQTILRFIPTHVGNSHHQMTARVLSPVHPHARGEQWPAENPSSFQAGSSPRTWGTVRHSGQCC